MQKSEINIDYVEDHLLNENNAKNTRKVIEMKIE